MKVKNHELVTLKVDDPAVYAREAGLVNNHAEWVREEIGAWRWQAMATHADRIKELVTAGYTIDFGGAAAPVGYGAVVVDYHCPAPSGPRSLLDVPPLADCIVCSHTLEHFVDADLAVVSMYHKLRTGGSLVVQVPSWRNQQLQGHRWDFHEQTFCLSWETNAPQEFTRLDDMLTPYFELEVCEVVDNCIIAIGHKR